MRWSTPAVWIAATLTVPGDAGFIAYKDADCSKKLTIKSDGTEVPDSKLLSDHSLMDTSFAGAHWYDNMDWGDASSTGDSGTGSRNVWFKPDPSQDATCEYVLMRDISQGWGYINPLPGQLVLRAPEEDCVYAPMLPGQGIGSSYCCGSDCDRIQVEFNSDGDLQKRGIRVKREDIDFTQPVPYWNTTHPKGSTGKAETGTYKLGSDEDPDKDKKQDTRSVGSSAARAGKTAKHEKREKIFSKGLGCEVLNPGEPFYTTGQQRAVTNVMPCDTECAHSKVSSTSTSTAVGVGSSHTFTWEGGVSFSVKAGFDFIIEGDATTESHMSFANAWEKSTSTTITTAKTETTIQTQTQIGGSTALMTFTPLNRCWQGEVKCKFQYDGLGLWFKMSDQFYCEPVQQDNLLSGEYSLMYMNGS